MPVSTSPATESTQIRKHAENVELYVQKILASVKGASALCPIDTPAKTDELASHWLGFYEVITTTFNSELESAILQHPDIIKTVPEIRQILGEGEGALEMTWADRIASARSPAEGEDGVTFFMYHLSDHY